MNKVLLIFILLIVSCNQQESCRVNKNLISKNDKAIGYLKSGVLHNVLISIDEPQLNEYKNETYRLIFFNSHGKVNASTLYKENENYFMSSKTKYASLDNHTKDSISEKSIREISEADWNFIKTNLEKISFWQNPVFLYNTFETNNIKDGAALIFEGYLPSKNSCTNRKYHLNIQSLSCNNDIFKNINQKIYHLSK